MDTIENLVKTIEEEDVAYKRQKLQVRLIGLLVDSCRYAEAIDCAARLVPELKRINDNQTIVGVHLQQSKAFYGLGDLEKSRVSLSAARIASNYTNISTKLEASINLQMGILYAADDNDYKNAESYFQEAFKGFDTDTRKDYNPELAALALKYVLLSKIMLDKPDDAVMTLKRNPKYSNRSLDAMVAIAESVSSRSFASFKKAFEDYPLELVQDPVVKRHFDYLYKTLIEKNLSRVVQPYSVMKISQAAGKIKLPVEEVEQHLTRMIQDGVISGFIDRVDGTLGMVDVSKKVPVSKLVLDAIRELADLETLL